MLLHSIARTLPGRVFPEQQPIWDHANHEVVLFFSTRKDRREWCRRYPHQGCQSRRYSAFLDWGTLATAQCLTSRNSDDSNTKSRPSHGHQQSCLPRPVHQLELGKPLHCTTYPLTTAQARKFCEITHETVVSCKPSAAFAAVTKWLNRYMDADKVRR